MDNLEKDALMSTLLSVETERDDLKAECERLEKENDKLKYTLDAFQRRYDDLFDCRDEPILRAMIDKLKYELNGLRAVLECAKELIAMEAPYCLTHTVKNIKVGAVYWEKLQQAIAKATKGDPK